MTLSILGVDDALQVQFVVHPFCKGNGVENIWPVLPLRLAPAHQRKHFRVTL